MGTEAHCLVGRKEEAAARQVHDSVTEEELDLVLRHVDRRVQPVSFSGRHADRATQRRGELTHLPRTPCERLRNRHSGPAWWLWGRGDGGACICKKTSCELASAPSMRVPTRG